MRKAYMIYFSLNAMQLLFTELFDGLNQQTEANRLITKSSASI